MGYPTLLFMKGVYPELYGCVPHQESREKECLSWGNVKHGGDSTGGGEMFFTHSVFKRAIYEVRRRRSLFRAKNIGGRRDTQFFEEGEVNILPPWLY